MAEDYYLLGEDLSNLGSGNLQYFPPIAGVDPIEATASEVLFEGAYVNVFEGGGQKARLASAVVVGETKRPATGFVKKNYAVGEVVKVYPIGLNTSHTQLTIGREYHLSDVEPGNLIFPVPEGIGRIKQPLGTATRTDSLYFIQRKYISII